ncbi:MAG TPA: carbon storage regulator [Terriglobia bacterium]|nr:carbon storage regulator [Terriglobia bacterium]
MLVLTRRVGERIVIAGDIQVTVLAVRGKKVRLGIAAPDSVRVDREEIHESRVGPSPAPRLPAKPSRPLSRGPVLQKN